MGPIVVRVKLDKQRLRMCTVLTDHPNRSPPRGYISAVKQTLARATAGYAIALRWGLFASEGSEYVVSMYQVAAGRGCAFECKQASSRHHTSSTPKNRTD